MIRPWRESDISKLKEIADSSFKDPWSLNTFISTFTSPVFYGLVCEFGGEIAGYIAASLVVDEVNVDDVAVAIKFRRKGIAKKLLSAAFEELVKRGAKKAFLEVRRSNEAAINLYKSFGFEVISERLKYYGDEDALIMQKII